MSWSNPTETLTNPAKMFISWNGASDGGYFYYDVKTGEKKEGKDVYEKRKIELPVTFLALDMLHTIKGFSDADQKQFWSNEVKDLRVEKLNVRLGKNTTELGLYSEIKDKLAKKGADYTQSVYVAIKDADEKLIIANVNMKGAALSAWIEFRQAVKEEIHKNAITIKTTKEGKKGAVKYLMPVFQLVKISEETAKTAFTLDTELQAYLTKYLDKNKAEEAEEELAHRVEKANESVYATKDEPEMSNHESIMGEGQQKPNEDVSNLVDDLPF